MEILAVLGDANCTEIFLDGSFITATLEPADYDICYEPTGMQATESWKALLNLTSQERKERHMGDIFIRLPVPPFFTDHVEFWQTDREDNPKGIIRIKLGLDAND